MGLAIWSASLNESSLLERPVSLVIMIFRCCDRPDFHDIYNTLVMHEAIVGIKPENLACVITSVE